MSFSNPFEFAAATDLSPNAILDYYIEDYNYSRFIQSKRNVFLLGERGSGKTMTLRYNAFDIQRRKREREGSDVDLSKIGVYVPCNTPLTHRREHELLPESRAAILSEHLLVLSIVHCLVETVSGAYDLLGEVPHQEFARELEAMLASELPRGKTFFDRLTTFLQAENRRTNQAVNAADDSFYVGAHSFATLAQPVLALLATLPALSQTHFLLMIDDADYLNRHQVASLNSWIAFRDHSLFSFKVATPKVSRPTQLTTSGGAILEGHDFTVVDLEKPLHNERSDFGHLAAQIIARRLELIKSPSSPTEYFPVSDSTLEQLEAARAVAQSEAEAKYPAGSRKQITDYVYKYHRAIFFRRGAQANLPAYSGFEMLKYLSTGVIRNLLEPAFWMFDKAVSRATVDEIDPRLRIPPSIQDEVIKEMSERAWERLRDGANRMVSGCSEEQGKQLYRLLDALARRFRERLYSEHSEPRATSFTISGPDGPERREVETLLAIARRGRFLYVRSGSAKEAGTRETYYVPHRILWPIRGLDPQGQHARISLRATDLLAASHGAYPWKDGDKTEPASLPFEEDV